jgi:lipoprotein-releasing system ATP-binding protein
MIQAINIQKSYGNLRVLKGVDLKIERGEIVTVVGKSGAGKSTLLNILAALDYADSGTVRVAGLDPAVLRGNELVEFRRRTVGMIFQMHHLLPQCSVLENVLAPSLADRRQARVNAETLARELLDWLGLAHRLDHSLSPLCLLRAETTEGGGYLQTSCSLQ